MTKVFGSLMSLLPRVPQRLLLGVELLLDPKLLGLEFLQAQVGGLQPADGGGLAQLEGDDVLVEFSDEGLFIRLNLKRGREVRDKIRNPKHVFKG